MVASMLLEPLTTPLGPKLHGQTHHDYQYKAQKTRIYNKNKRTTVQLMVLVALMVLAALHLCSFSQFQALASLLRL